VASAFQDLGCAVIDADDLGHRALQQPPIVKNIAAQFGSEVVRPNGSVDRAALGGIVFRDPDKLASLNHLLHPWILERCQAKLLKFQNNPAVKAIVLDMPLLMEVQWDALCDHIVFIECPKEICLQRAEKRGIGPENLVEREKKQISLDKKARRADNIVNNTSDLSSLVRQVTKIFTNVINN